ncbi:WD repeat-containing protein 91 [Phytophthora cinnamomi]|uniref:WD repeat-containing protein 91 n=1 Tax=Phytophthora cinnamomi TaxID=4785 RepID=UPI00355A21FF|nr:WD repeat-containing protein 91 [Phytophthora cinnamomi]
MDTVRPALQHERITVTDVRLPFDSVVAGYPVMAEHVRASAKVVHSPLFESALVKVGNGNTLTATDTRAAKCFEATSDSEDEGEGCAGGKKNKKKPRCDCGVAILRDGKKHRVSARTSVRYMALAKLMPPTSSTVERLFPTRKLIMT